MSLVLSPLDHSVLSIDLSGITPDRLAGLHDSAVAKLPIEADGRRCELGFLFAVEGSADDGRIRCRGDFSRVHAVAAGMVSGTIEVSGSVGRRCGAGMTGGSVQVGGDAGDWLAAEMAGGTIRVAGSVGDNAAAAFSGSREGMRGGMVVISGSAGSLAGSRMRRGILAIAGDCGAATGFELRAGTVLVGGTLGSHPGLGMRRGSIIAAGLPPDLPATFLPGATWSPAFLPLLARKLATAGFRPSAPEPNFLGGTWTQWHGDALAGGRGEILTRPVDRTETPPHTHA